MIRFHTNLLLAEGWFRYSQVAIWTTLLLGVSHYLHYHLQDYLTRDASECVYFSETSVGEDLRTELHTFDNIFTRKMLKHLPERDIFIYGPTCAGFGNQLFKYASLYGLGKRLHRQPFFDIREKCQLEMEMEIRMVFFGFYGRMYFYTPSTAASTKTYSFANCCKYVVPDDIKNRTEHLIRIDGALQNYRYFHDYRHDLRIILKCLPTIEENISEYNRNLMGVENMSNRAHRKICVHTRLGDFVHAKLATSFNYTVRAIDHIIENETLQNPQAVFSVLLLGIDNFFLESVKVAKEKEFKPNANIRYFVPRSQSRALDMCYGMHTCDTILITAGASTYSWWMAYLSNATIYYNPNFEGLSEYNVDNFLPEWNQLRITDL